MGDSWTKRQGRGGQGCHSNFSQGTNPIDFNQFLKLLHEGEAWGAGAEAGAGDSTCPVANKEKTKNSKESIEKVLPRCQRQRHRQISRPSTLHVPRRRFIYTLSRDWRYRMSDKRNSKWERKKNGKNCGLNPLAACGIPIGPDQSSSPGRTPKCTSRHAHGYGLSMELRIQMAPPTLSFSLLLTLCLSLAHTSYVECYVVRIERRIRIGIRSNNARANVTNKTQRCEIKNDIRIQIE